MTSASLSPSTTCSTSSISTSNGLCMSSTLRTPSALRDSLIANALTNLPITKLPCFTLIKPDVHESVPASSTGISDSAMLVRNNAHSISSRKLPVAPGLIVMKGFGKFIIKPDTTVVAPRLGQQFPPCSNAAYELSMNKRPLIPAEMPDKMSSDNLIAVQAATLQNDSSEETTKIKASVGGHIAGKINWSRKPYDDSNGSSSGITPSSAQSSLVKTIDDAVAAGQHPFEWCSVCQRRHIIPGPPMALQDVDTCYSMLPDWFPKDDFERPWEEFQKMVNEFVRQEEVRSGLLPDPLESRWDKEYHEPTVEWMQVGRRGGWWKCRTGLEGNEKVPEIERTCELCHREPTAEEKALDKKRAEDKARRKRVQDWVRAKIEHRMALDRELVLARWKAERF